MTLQQIRDQYDVVWDGRRTAPAPPQTPIVLESWPIDTSWRQTAAARRQAIETVLLRQGLTVAELLAEFRCTKRQLDSALNYYRQRGRLRSRRVGLSAGHRNIVQYRIVSRPYRQSRIGH